MFIQPRQRELKSVRLTAKSWCWLGLLLLILLILAGCRRSGQDLSDVGVSLVVDPNPPQVGEAMVTLTLSDSTGQPITGAEVEFEGNMSHAGHGSHLCPPHRSGSGPLRSSTRIPYGRRLVYLGAGYST